MQVSVMEDDRKAALKANTGYNSSLKIVSDDFSREFNGQPLLFELIQAQPSAHDSRHGPLSLRNSGWNGGQSCRNVAM